MKRRRSVARLVWAIPVVAAIGATAVTSDASFVAPPIQALPSSTSTEHVPLLAASTSTSTSSELSTTVVATDATVADSQPVPTALPTALPPSSSEYILDVPSIGLSQPVVAGDQTQIDQGGVTAVDWSAYGYPASCQPGEGCTIWLAGHRSTHGAVFARLPELAVGASIAIQFRGHVHDYTVTDISRVPGSAPPSVVHGDLVLQTSLPGNRRLLIYADESGVSR